MAKQAPAKSRDVYEKAWRNLASFLKKDLGRYEPIEGDYIRYFNFLRKAKKYKASTMWSMYSRVKNCHIVSSVNNCSLITYVLISAFVYRGDMALVLRIIRG